uniref:Amine Dehydrogenase n=1 Tax=metagenome TaxID=256318 RepID=UPI001FBC14F4
MHHHHHHSPLRVALYGFGNQNKEMAKMLVERKDVEIVAVISNKSNVGKDFGEVIGLAPQGILVTAGLDAAETLRTTNPQIAMLSTLSTVGDIESQLRACAENKVNVYTIAEELTFSWTSAPEKTKEMDELFKEHNVSLIGGGFLDGACCDMARTMAAMMHKIDKLDGGLQYNVDHYGQVLAIAHGVGLSEEEFYAENGPGWTSPTSYPKSYVYNMNDWFASAFGLTVIKTEEVKTPTKAPIELYSEAIGRAIPVGQCTGMIVTATTTTEEGVIIVEKQVGKCYEDGDEDMVFMNLEGNPTGGVGFTMKNPPTPAMTNTIAISRMFQTVDAPAGYITTDKLPTMEAYVHGRL